MLLRITAILTLVASLTLADTLTLKSGKTVTGTYLGGSARQVRMAVEDRVETYSVDEISTITFGHQTAASSPAPAAPTAAAVAPATPSILRPERTYATTAPAATAATSGTVIPAGTQVVIRMIDNVDSEQDNVGKTYRASLDEPITSNGGDVLVPRGADVVVKLVNDQQSGKIQGRTVLTLDLVSLTVNGRAVDINTQEVEQASGSRGAKSAKVVGGATALGAIIGAIAGGGKGAAIGAVSGAGAGAAVQVLTKGEKVKIPSETRLTFTLQQAVKI